MISLNIGIETQNTNFAWDTNLNYDLVHFAEINMDLSNKMYSKQNILLALPNVK